MSYTRNYHRTVSQSYSKTETFSYPASESGGSKSVTISGTVEVPIDISIHVDTDAFDDSVGGCRNSVNGLNAAVIATTTAEIIAKNQASKRVAGTIIDGFFKYISSELSQLRSELTAKCDSILVTLFEQKTSCEDKGKQMKGDYDRIASRYLKLFSDLDSELHNRIIAIDKPIFSLNRDLLVSTSRTTDTSLLGISTVVSAETSRLDAILASSSIKGRAQYLIGKTNDYLTGSYYLQNSLSKMLYDGNNSSKYMLPVIYVESYEESNNIKRDTYGSSAMPLKSLKNLDSDLSTRFQSSNLSWGEMDRSDYEQVDTYFRGEINSSHLDSRVAKMMMSLKANSNINVVKK